MGTLNRDLAANTSKEQPILKTNCVINRKLCSTYLVTFKESSSKETKKEKRPAFVFSSGAVYEGEWIGNMRDGYGSQTWPDGAKYEGITYMNTVSNIM